MGITQSVEHTKTSIKDSIQDEITKRMMIQREVQMAVNIAKARDMIHIYGSLWLSMVAGMGIAKVAGKPIPSIAGIPVAVGAIVLGNFADMAYGNKLQRVNKEAEYILSHERARMVPFPQAPFAKFYTAQERSILYDPATAVGDLAPFCIIRRRYTPPN